MSILTPYRSDIEKVLSAAATVVLRSNFYEPGYSNYGLSLPSFNRTLEPFKNKTSYKEYVKKISGRFSQRDDTAGYLRSEKIELKLPSNLKEFPFNLTASNNVRLDQVNFEFSANSREEIKEYIFQNQQIRISFKQVTRSSLYQGEISNVEYKVQLFLLQRVGLPVFISFNDAVLKYVLDTDIIYTLSERRLVVQYFRNLYQARGKITNGKDEYSLDSGLLSTARNLKLRDMTYGGLVGNSRTAYGVAPKADGLRKLILVHSTGIWIVTLPYRFNLVVRLVGFDQYVGSSFDAELMSSEKRLQGSSNAKYWLLLFDTLSSTDPNNPNVASTSVQNYTKSVRIAYAYTFAKEYSDFLDRSIQDYSTRSRLYLDQSKKSITQNTAVPDLIPIVYFTKKERFLFRTVAEFYNSMQNLFLRTFTYMTDGYMIEPEDTPYNTRAYEHPFEKRILTQIPDICKIKPVEEQVMDMLLRKLDNGVFLYGVKSKKNRSTERYELFTGNRFSPFDSTMLDQDNLANLPNNSVLEMYWDLKDKKLKLKKLRTDKSEPNSVDVLERIWSDIHRPIQTDTYLGLSDQLVRYYHNSIKRSIFARDKGRKLLDVGAGHGASVNEYDKYDRIVAVEPNPESILELRRRLQNIGIEKKVLILETGGQNTDVITRACKSWLGGPADTVCMMNTMTFFWKDQQTFDSLVRTLDQNLKLGGQLLFLTFDGDILNEIFRPKLLQKNEMVKNDILELGDLITIKYIGKDSANPTEKPFINIDIKQSQVRNQDEWLVHLSDLETKFELIYKKRAIDEKFLSANELIFSSLYSYGIFWKSNSKNLSESGNLIQEFEMPMSSGPSDIDQQLIAETRELQQEQVEPLDFSKIRSPRANLSLSPRRVQILPINNPLLPIPLGLSDEDRKIELDINNSMVEQVIPVTPKGKLILPTNKLVLPTNKLVLPANKIVGVPVFEAKTATIQRYTTLGVPSTVQISVPIPQAEPSLSLQESPLLNSPINIPVDDQVYNSSLDSVVYISTVSNYDSFYQAILKSFYPAYADVAGYGYRSNLITQFKQDLRDLVQMDDNYQGLKNLLGNQSLTVSQVQALFSQSSLQEAKLLQTPRNLPVPSQSNFNILLSHFISRAIGINIVIYDNNFHLIYDAQNTEADYVILLYNFDTDYWVIGRQGSSKPDGSDGIQSIFLQDDPIFDLFTGR